MRILFYLPVVTRWWFNEIIGPMLRTLHGGAELHVMVAPLWRSTGIDAQDLAPLMDADAIVWHIVDPEDPALFRTDGAAVPGLLDLVRGIAPDLTLCRSAEQVTPAQFPGEVRFLMEGGAAPFDTDQRWIVLERSLFAYGHMTEAEFALASSALPALAPLWSRGQRHLAQAPKRDWRVNFDLPRDRPILAVPLQYEHEEDFFIEHSAFPRAVDLLAHLFATVDEDVFLAVTDHPLNRVHVDRSAVAALIAAHPDRARMCVADELPFGATGLLATHADAMLVDQSKCWTLAAFAETPILHIGNAPLASWLAASRDIGQQPSGFTRPDGGYARQWFAWHLGGRLFDSTCFTLDELMARVAGIADASSIAAKLDNLGRLHWREAA